MHSQMYTHIIYSHTHILISLSLSLSLSLSIFLSLSLSPPPLLSLHTAESTGTWCSKHIALLTYMVAQICQLNVNEHAFLTITLSHTHTHVPGMEALSIQSTPTDSRFNRDSGYELPDCWFTLNRKLRGGAPEITARHAPGSIT